MVGNPASNGSRNAKSSMDLEGSLRKKILIPVPALFVPKVFSSSDLPQTRNPSGTIIPPNSFYFLLTPLNSSQFLGLKVP